MGYHRAGFEVVGVDLSPQKNYPFEFIQGDAMSWLTDMPDVHFDAIHASPPCQGYSRTARLHPGIEYPLLIEPTRILLEKSGLPWIGNKECKFIYKGSYFPGHKKISPVYINLTSIVL